MGAFVDSGHARAAGATLGVTRFSTAALDPRDRHEAWWTRDWPSIAALFDARPAGAFYAESESMALGDVSVSFGQYGEQSIMRSPARLRSDGVDHIGVTMLLAGRIEGDWANIGPGGLAISDMATPFTHTSSDCDLVTIAIPRAQVAARGIDGRALHGTSIGPAFTSMLRSHLYQIRAATGVIAAEDGPMLGNTVVDLLAVTLATAGRVAKPAGVGIDGPMRHRAEQLIEAGVDHPGLGPSYLCRELGVSRATLYRLFADQGGVQQRIRAARLMAARRALIDPACRVGEVADRFGFGDPAYFSRAFRAEFGMSPSDWRDRQPDLPSSRA